MASQETAKEMKRSCVLALLMGLLPAFETRGPTYYVAGFASATVTEKPLWKTASVYQS